MAVKVLDRAAGESQAAAPGVDQIYEYGETRELVALVQDAAELIRIEGEAAFAGFRETGSRWRQQERYIFVLDRGGNMLVHPDPSLEGRNTLDLKDIEGKPIVRGLIEAATRPGKPEGWYHYQWPVPGGLLPRWKSSYVKLASTPSDEKYVVGSGVYNDRMERAFVVDLVKAAAAEIEKDVERAFSLFHDPTGPFLAKDAYIFVYDTNGVNLVLPPFSNLEGRNLLDMKDTQGKELIREMLNVAQTQGSGWVDYMWPKPGESVSTQKSAFVSAAHAGDTRFMVGCGVYLADAPRAPRRKKMTASELMQLVREAAAVFEERGEQAYPEFRAKGSKWFGDETYFYVRTMDADALFHAADPEGQEGRNVADMKDILGRPFSRMITDVGSAPSGEGWVHYMYPQPGEMFPTWKSAFVKRVTFPSGQRRIIGAGIYDMQMDRAFIEYTVNRAAALIERDGKKAFDRLRDKTGPFLFMDTYVFVMTMDGTELVNPAQPSLEGKNIRDVRDLNGKAVVEDEIAAVNKYGSAWLDCCWYRPGDNTPAPRQTFVRKVQSGAETYIVGSGVYLE